MKKNMLAVLILILTVVNLSLTAFCAFLVIPNAKKTDELITNVLSIIDLELESPLPEDYAGKTGSYDITQVEKYVFDELKANLKTGEDGKAHYAVISASLTINKEHKDYETLQPMVDTMKSDLNTIVINNVKKHTAEELNNPDVAAQVKQDILADVQSLFGSTFICDCTLSYLTQ